MLQDFSIAVGLLAMLLIALELGFRLGRRAAETRDPGAGGQVGAIQGAVLGLLGLLLGFSFAGAATRFIEKQDLIVQEANAIGTASLRADLLSEPHRTELRAALKSYTEHRIAISSRLRQGLTADDHADFERLQTQIWSAAMAGVENTPNSILGVLPPINDVIDLHSVRLASGRRHLPMLVVGLLIASSVLAMGTMGYGSGLTGHRRTPLTASLALLIGLSLWITIDLDHPRAGLMQLSDAPLQGLKLE